MTNLWKINDNDIFATYSAMILKDSYLEIMSPPIPKKRLEHDFPDANGTEVDTVSDLIFESRRYMIKILIVANTREEFWTNYNALIEEIATPGTFSLYVSDLGVTVNLLYEGAKCTSKPKSLKNGRIAVAYEVSVFEPNPINRTYDND